MSKTATDQNLYAAIEKESQKFEESYLWLQRNMSKAFFEEIHADELLLVAHNLVGFNLQGYFSRITLKNLSIVLCLDSDDADLKILESFEFYGIKNYRVFTSKAPLDFIDVKRHLRIALVYFTEAAEKEALETSRLTLEQKRQLSSLLVEIDSDLDTQECLSLLKRVTGSFVRSLTLDRLAIALTMLHRAQTRDMCQYATRRNKDWKQDEEPSLEIFLAWRNTPKANFLYRLARVVYRHGLVMKRMRACYIDHNSRQSILLMVLSVHGSDGRASWDVCDVDDFLQELVTVKYFSSFDAIDKTFVESKLIRGNLANFLRALKDAIHQVLVYSDANLYSLNHIEEALCRHPELTVKICHLFELRFHPVRSNPQKYEEEKESLLAQIQQIDTGHEVNDIRRKNVLLQSINLIRHTLKTNFYQRNKTALSFRLDPLYLEHVPYDRTLKFPELPYGIFFIKGMHFIGFHIRFRDLARGGLRTIYTEQLERMLVERNHVFQECYNLAHTQQKKNKDIPEGGAKGVIFLQPNSRLESEAAILESELVNIGLPKEKIATRLKQFREEQRLEYLHQAQRSWVSSLVMLVNCESNGALISDQIVDYWQKPEYLYLGPDENMHNEMISWIAEYSKKHQYKPKGAFISGKTDIGINHKQYGVTSLGVNVYMDEVLRHLGIDPQKDTFTVKIAGGPDGDVAGNQIHNLYRFYPKTAKLVALVDVSGTIYDPEGLDLSAMEKLFIEQKPIRFYPADQLHEDGFLLDKFSRKETTAYASQTLCLRKKGGQIAEEWLNGHEMNHLLRTNVHQAKADVFIPAGGRPRTLNESNWKEFLDNTKSPTAKAIIEGANLYLTTGARRALEEMGVLIIKDSSANKCGVICSSFEILCGLTLEEREFLEKKETLVAQIQDILQKRALDEARLLLTTHRETKKSLVDLSNEISHRINDFTDQLLHYLEPLTLPMNPTDPLMRCFLEYCPKLLREEFHNSLLLKIPDSHKKAIIACSIASNLVYKKGLKWSPSLIDVLPLVL